MLDELAVDPRAYDFDHPVNKRPNYLFGQWDLGKLDNSGRCRRFVLQQISLDAMLQRIAQRNDVPYEEVLFEEAAVLAGTMLMGSGVSGNRPDAHDSSVTLATLVQQIAQYRDEFYEKLLAGLSGERAGRLRAEAVTLRQPLGGAGSTSTSASRGDGPSNCNTSTSPCSSPAWDTPRRRPARSAPSPSPRRG